jgi:hypothetical protein
MRDRVIVITLVVAISSIAVIPKTEHDAVMAIRTARVHPFVPRERSEGMMVACSDGRHMDTIQRLNALAEDYALILIDPSKTQVPLAQSKCVDCPGLRRCHRKPNRHRGNAHALDVEPEVIAGTAEPRRDNPATDSEAAPPPWRTTSTGRAAVTG